MRGRWFALFLAVAGPAMAAPLEPPIVTTDLQVRQERDAACAEVRAGRSGARKALVMTDICHGWTTEACGDRLLVRGMGVTEDQAKVLFARANRAVDLVSLVDGAIRARWPGHEHLHLQFEAGTCEAGGLVVTFNGSHIKTGASGPASGMHGVIRLMAPDSHTLGLKPDD